MASGGAFHCSFPHASQQAFLEGHERAFAYFGGVFGSKALAVQRFDRVPGGDPVHMSCAEYPTNTFTVVKVLMSQAEAEAEVARLNQVNAGKSCVYLYCTSRLSRRAIRMFPRTRPPLSLSEMAIFSPIDQPFNFRVADTRPQSCGQCARVFDPTALGARQGHWIGGGR
jgi:hypothetical protein